jgi:hypothetical protein
VGVILNLVVWFGFHVFFPGGRRMDWFAVVVSLIAFFGMLKWNGTSSQSSLAAHCLGWCSNRFRWAEFAIDVL